MEVFVEGPLAADIIFDTPAQGFFADFLFAGNTQQLTLSLVNGGTTDIQVPGPGTSLEPFGFISTGDTIVSIRMNNSVNDGFYIDNISGAVPEPASLFLMGAGLAGVVSRVSWNRARGAGRHTV